MPVSFILLFRFFRFASREAYPAFSRVSLPAKYCTSNVFTRALCTGLSAKKKHNQKIRLMEIEKNASNFRIVQHIGFTLLPEFAQKTAMRFCKTYQNEMIYCTII